MKVSQQTRVYSCQCQTCHMYVKRKDIKGNICKECEAEKDPKEFKYVCDRCRTRHKLYNIGTFDDRWLCIPCVKALKALRQATPCKSCGKEMVGDDYETGLHCPDVKPSYKPNGKKSCRSQS